MDTCIETKYWLLESILKLIWNAFDGKLARFASNRWNGFIRNEWVRNENKCWKTNKLVTANTFNECPWKMQLEILVIRSHLSFHPHVLKWVQCAQIGHLSDQNSFECIIAKAETAFHHNRQMLKYVWNFKHLLNKLALSDGCHSWRLPCAVFYESSTFVVCPFEPVESIFVWLLRRNNLHFTAHGHEHTGLWPFTCKMMDSCLMIIYSLVSWNVINFGVNDKYCVGVSSWLFLQ